MELYKRPVSCIAYYAVVENRGHFLVACGQNCVTISPNSAKKQMCVELKRMVALYLDEYARSVD